MHNLLIIIVVIIISILIFMMIDSYRKMKETFCGLSEEDSEYLDSVK